MLRSMAVALGAILVLSAAQPASAAGGRAEARSSGKAARSAAPAPARAPALRPAITASRRPVAIVPNLRASRSAERAPRFADSGRATIRTAARGVSARSERVVTASRSGRLQARSAGRREAYRAADRRESRFERRQAWLPAARPGLRMVSLFSSPAAAATLPARGGKYGKPSRSENRSEGRSEGRGIWHAGLPAADGEQMDCPAGTMAVLARGHADTFRCMPM
ncbi:hypothetical protein [Roseomonas sp. WA12]